MKNNPTSALKNLARRYSVISPLISHRDLKDEDLRFEPSIIKDGRDSIRQSVHFVYKNGYVDYNVVPSSTFYVKNRECILAKSGSCIKQVLQQKRNVVMIVVVIHDRLGREMFVYHIKSIMNFMT